MGTGLAGINQIRRGVQRLQKCKFNVYLPPDLAIDPEASWPGLVEHAVRSHGEANE